jgi:hypothetical protein
MPLQCAGYRRLRMALHGRPVLGRQARKARRPGDRLNCSRSGSGHALFLFGAVRRGFCCLNNLDDAQRLAPQGNRVHRMRETYQCRRNTADDSGYCRKSAALLCSLARTVAALRAVCRKWPRFLCFANVAKLLVATGLSFLILVPSSGEPRIAGRECPLIGNQLSAINDRSC